MKAGASSIPGPNPPSRGGPPGPTGPPKGPRSCPSGSIAFHCSGVNLKYAVQMLVSRKSSAGLAGSGSLDGAAMAPASPAQMINAKRQRNAIARANLRQVQAAEAGERIALLDLAHARTFIASPIHAQQERAVGQGSF